MSSGEPLSTFRINIREGRNLAPKDPGGTSDPYWICGFLDNKGKWLRKYGEAQKSTVVEKCLNPQWTGQEKSFQFPDSLRPTFRIEVWDKDKLSNDDFMGQLEIPFSTLVDGKLFEGWFTLLSRPGKNDDISGEIFTSFIYKSHKLLTEEINEQEKKTTKQNEEREKARMKKIMGGNILRWINIIEQSNEQVEWMDSTKEMYTSFVNDQKYVDLFLEFNYFPNFIRVVRNRIASFSTPNIFYVAIVNGIIGKLSELPSFHAAIYEENAHFFCIENIKFISISLAQESLQSCLLIIQPLFSLITQGETDVHKRELAEIVTPVLGDLLRQFNEQPNYCRELILHIVAILALISQNIGTDYLTARIMPHLGNLYLKWPGDTQIYTQVAHIFYYVNHTPKSEEYLVPISPSVINGLRGTVLSRYHGSSFEEDPTLVKSVIPILALFTWICNAQAISTLCSPKVFYVLCENVANILYGCLERGNMDGVLASLGEISVTISSAVTKLLNLYSRHPPIVSVATKIVSILEKNDDCARELKKLVK